MNRRSVLLYIVAVLTGAVLLTGMAGAGELNKEKKEPARMVTDCAGRRVEIPQTVERIACLYLPAGHAVTMLGRGDDIVAVSKGLKRDSLLLEICPSINNARVPKTQLGINTEELLNAHPDLVLLSDDVGQDTGETDKLNAVHIPYLIVDYTTLSGQQQAVTMIGEALGGTEKAQAYVRYYKQCIQRVRAVVSNLPEAHRLRVYQSVNEANRTPMARSLSTDWLNVLGVINVACEDKGHLSGGKNFVTLEQILAWNPDVILVNEPSVKKQILTDDQWAPLKAVKTKKVYLMPIAISRWGHPGSIETPMAILWAAKTLYPKRFSDLDMVAETRFFYKTFFNHALSDQQIQQILDGKLKRKPKRNS